MTIPKQAITFLGGGVALLALLGFPGSFKTPLFFILGILIAYISYQEHHHHSTRRMGIKRTRKMKGAVSIPVASEVVTEGSEAVVDSLNEPHGEVASQ